jgi:hypothetical protein
LEIATIHVDPTADPSALSPIRRGLVLLWLLALKDRANSVEHTYESSVSKLKYKIDGQWHDLMPFPNDFGPLVGQEIRNWLNPSLLRRSLADQLRRLASRFDPREEGTIHYLFMLVLGPTWSLWRATIQAGDGRGEVTFDLIECTDWAYDQMSRITLAKSKSGGIDLANPSKIWND